MNGTLLNTKSELLRRLMALALRMSVPVMMVAGAVAFVGCDTGGNESNLEEIGEDMDEAGEDMGEAGEEMMEDTGDAMEEMGDDAQDAFE